MTSVRDSLIDVLGAIDASPRWSDLPPLLGWGFDYRSVGDDGIEIDLIRPSESLSLEVEFTWNGESWEYVGENPFLRSEWKRQLSNGDLVAPVIDFLEAWRIEAGV